MLKMNTVTYQTHFVKLPLNFNNNNINFKNYTNLFLPNPPHLSLCLKNPPFNNNTHLLCALPGNNGEQKWGNNNEQKWVYEGLITESLPDLFFRVRVIGDDNVDKGDTILCYLSGKMKLNHIRLIVGDKVKVELSRYDSSRGRIIYRQDSRERSDKPPKKVKKKGPQSNMKKK